MASLTPRRSRKHYKIGGFYYCLRCGRALVNALIKAKINYEAELMTTTRDVSFSCKGCDDHIDGAV